MRQLFLKFRAMMAALQKRVRYIDAYPCDQNAVELFSGEWASEMPPETAHTGGYFRAYEDPRIVWGMNLIGGAANKLVIELGPMEAGHSLLMERMGAGSVLAIEANPRAYLKCLVTKEINQLQRCRFLLGDFVKYLKNTVEKFDICIASGVLYHMTDPVELLSLIAKTSNSAIIWTHYYSEEIIRKSGRNLQRISQPEFREFDGLKYSVHRQHYGISLFRRGFCGGPNKYSYWMPLDDVMRALKHFGFTTVETGFHEPMHQNGPAISITCLK